MGEIPDIDLIHDHERERECPVVLTFQSVDMENEENGGEGGAGDGEIPEIELIIRASTIDGRRKGACLFCQVAFLFTMGLNCF